MSRLNGHPLGFDAALVDMIDGALETIRAWIDAGGGIFTIDDVMWDFPAATPEIESIPVPFKLPEVMAAPLKVSHAIGFVCGCAAMANLTPLELVWSMPEPAPIKALPQPTTTTRKRRKAQKAT